MTNSFYDTFLEGLLNKEFDLNSDIIKATLIDSADYTFSAAHDFYGGASNDVPAAAKVAESPQLGSPTITSGTFDTANFTWSTVSGDPCEAVILWDDSITDDRLMVFYDTGMTGMPVTPSGGDIDFTVNGSGWFAL